MSGVPAIRAFQPSLLILLVASLLLVVVVAARASVTPAAPAPPARAVLPAVVQAAGDQDYVGTGVCADCHADEAKSYEGGAHARVADLRAPAAVHGCESCHGPGRAHADDPGNPALMVSPRAIDAATFNATCTTCHATRALRLWDGSSHESRGLSCRSCHTIHAAASAPLLTRTSESATCADCHQAEVSRTNRSAHTSAHAASMTCSSCHNAHGTVADGLLRVGQTGNDTCVSCHAGMRGPFLWEHAPVRESCVSCHEPHGSSIPGMLIARQPLLCQQCGTVVDRENRVFARTTEDSYRASIDSTSLGALILRGQVERAARRGSRYDEDVLVRTGEQPTLRHFDIADRDRTRVTGTAHWMPAAVVALSASAAAGRDNYGGSGFGLRDNRHRTWTMAVDLTPVSTVAAGLTYTSDRHAADQRSRAASGGNLAQFTDPTRDWMAEADDVAHVVAATLDLLRAVPRTDVRVSWDLSRSTTTYVLRTADGSTLTPPQPLPAVRNDLRSGSADIRYHLTDQTSLGITWWHERYRVDDRALSPATFDRLDLPSTLFMGWVVRPYALHAASVRLMYRW